MSQRFLCFMWVLGLTAVAVGGCERLRARDGTMSEAERGELAERVRLMTFRHMPCSAEAVAAVLDGYLAEKRTVSAELVPIDNTHGERYAWVIRVEGKTVAVLTDAPQGVAAHPVAGPATEALMKARHAIAMHSSQRGTDSVEDVEKRGLGAEQLTADYQERVYGLQIVHIALVDAHQMRWEITAKPAQKHTLGGEIWLTIVPGAKVRLEFGR